MKEDNLSIYYGIKGILEKEGYHFTPEQDEHCVVMFGAGMPCSEEIILDEVEYFERTQKRHRDQKEELAIKKQEYKAKKAELKKDLKFIAKNIGVLFR